MSKVAHTALPPVSRDRSIPQVWAISSTRNRPRPLSSSGPGLQRGSLFDRVGVVVALRQSTDPSGPALIYTPEEIAAFVRGINRGLADHLTAR
ncbi:hypothetical protein SALBM311S_11052 [Streptomyces alboniger]